MPVVDFLQNDNLRMVLELGICAKGSVESVLLQSNKPLENIKSIRLFPESRTSNILIRILISQYFGINHHICFTMNNIETDAYIIIGDKAIKQTKPKYTYDLSEMWYEQTNLPFVFAVWVYKADCPNHEIIESILKSAKQKGVLNIPLLSRIYAEKLQLSSSFIEHYLSDCLYYDVGPQEIEGIEKFDQWITRINHTETTTQVRSISQNKKETHEGIRQLYSSRQSSFR